MDSKEFQELRLSLPTSPGIYQFFNQNSTLIYVGKAKNIQNRVSSYFKNKYDNAKTKLLVKQIHHIEFTVVQNETDAFLLENLFIKKNQPKYNIQLKDDKTYPQICIKNERFPRVFLTRNIVKDGSTYLGPYTSVKKVRLIIQLLQAIFPLRSCNLNLSASNIKKKKYKVCLEYHIGNCKGPCENFQPEEDYNNKLMQITNILKGKINPVIADLKIEMKANAKSLAYEKAHIIKNKIEVLHNYQSTSTIVNPTINNVDVFSIIDNDTSAFVNYLNVVNGSIIQTKTIELKRKLNESLQALLAFAILTLREQFKSTTTQLLLPFKLEILESQFTIIVPLKGDKKKLLTLSENNARYYKIQKQVRQTHSSVKQISILEQLQKELRMNQLPLHIECFDNSNFQGSNPVASVVVFKNGKPAKADYRHFNIKTVIGANDFASMEEIVFRRYKSLQDEPETLPQLIVIDGGKGQLSAAVKALKLLGLDNKIAVVSIAKRLEEIYYPEDPVPLYINKKSTSLKLIQQLRNEAHRFAITFHRLKRKNDLLQTQLTTIRGIGQQTSNQLLKAFKSEKKIRQATLNELASIIGTAKAKAVLSHYNNS